MSAVSLVAQVVQPAPAGWRAWTLTDWVVAIIIVAAVVAILYVALQAMGITLPEWFKRIAIIVVVAIVAILAIKLILSL
jgi:hypothetical protein